MDVKSLMVLYPSSLPICTFQIVMVDQHIKCISNLSYKVSFWGFKTQPSSPAQFYTLFFRRKKLQGHGFLNMCQVSCVKPGQHKSYYYRKSEH